MDLNHKKEKKDFSYFNQSNLKARLAMPANAMVRTEGDHRPFFLKMDVNGGVA